jgi:hypothetical protein
LSYNSGSYAFNLCRPPNELQALLEESEAKLQESEAKLQASKRTEAGLFADLAKT